MLTRDEIRYFEVEQELHERTYLAGANPRQSGFGRNERDWKRFLRSVVSPVHMDGAFLDIGCANGLLMESVVTLGTRRRISLEPYGPFRADWWNSPCSA